MKNLNVQKLAKSDFSTRLLAFAKDYSKAKNVNFYDDIVDWFIDQNYTYIKSFLASSCSESDNVNQSLLDRKMALYEEFVSFYE